ncbi:MAG TPA: hypothetical protein PLV42_12015 [bacterium]|nr:hypothetical protein [bacterium]
MSRIFTTILFIGILFVSCDTKNTAPHDDGLSGDADLPIDGDSFDADSVDGLADVDGEKDESDPKDDGQPDETVLPDEIIRWAAMTTVC